MYKKADMLYDLIYRVHHKFFHYLKVNVVTTLIVTILYAHPIFVHYGLNKGKGAGCKS